VTYFKVPLWLSDMDTMRKASVTVTSNSADIRTQYLLNISLEHYNRTKLLGIKIYFPNQCHVMLSIKIATGKFNERSRMNTLHLSSIFHAGCVTPEPQVRYLKRVTLLNTTAGVFKAAVWTDSVGAGTHVNYIINSHITSIILIITRSCEKN
jgi:hypothetical protein